MSISGTGHQLDHHSFGNSTGPPSSMRSRHYLCRKYDSLVSKARKLPVFVVLWHLPFFAGTQHCLLTLGFLCPASSLTGIFRTVRDKTKCTKHFVHAACDCFQDVQLRRHRIRDCSFRSLRRTPSGYYTYYSSMRMSTPFDGFLSSFS